jgi:hypothetical protein
MKAPVFQEKPSPAILDPRLTGAQTTTVSIPRYSQALVIASE